MVGPFKIGSSSLTSRNGAISYRKLVRLVDEIAQIKDDGHEVVLISFGAVAAGYRKLGFIERPNHADDCIKIHSKKARYVNTTNWLRKQ